MRILQQDSMVIHMLVKADFSLPCACSSAIAVYSFLFVKVHLLGNTLFTHPVWMWMH